MKTKILALFMLLIALQSCSEEEVKKEAPKISVNGNVWDDFKNEPVRGLKIYAYKPGHVFWSGPGFKIMDETITDSEGNYGLVFEKTNPYYYVAFSDLKNKYIYSPDENYRFLNNPFNTVNFTIRQAKVFKAKMEVINNKYSNMGINCGGYTEESKAILKNTQDTILYFRANPKGVNLFQMYVQEPDYEHYWYKNEIKDCEVGKDTTEIVIKANLNEFKRYKNSQNPGS
jgi:hypothetical protein